jgi:AAT family amino acid transporter/GABA permease
LTGILVLLVMRMLGEMAIAYPETLSFTEYARLGLGDCAGFVTGWLYWFFWVVVVAVEAMAAAAVLEPLLGIPAWAAGLLLIAAMTLTNVWSARAYGEFEFWFASIKVGAIVAFVLIAGSYLFGIKPPSGTGIFTNLTADGGFAPFGFGAIFAGVTSVVFTLVGAEIATVAAAESVDRERAVARLTVSLILRVTVFYVLSLLLILCIVPWRAIIPGQSPFVAALQVMHIPGAPMIMNFIVLTAVLSALNSALYVTSRTIFVLAAHGDAPQFLVALNKRRVPARSILFGTVFGYCGVLLSIVSPHVVFAFLINASGAVMLFVYLILAMAQIVSRRSLEATQPARLRLKMWLFPWLSYAVVVAIAGILVAMALTRSLASQFYASALSLVVAVAIYVLRRRAMLPARLIAQSGTSSDAGSA